MWSVHFSVVESGKLSEEPSASIFSVGPEYDDSTLLWNICAYLPNCTADIPGYFNLINIKCIH